MKGTMIRNETYTNAIISGEREKWRKGRKDNPVMYSSGRMNHCHQLLWSLVHWVNFHLALHTNRRHTHTHTGGEKRRTFDDRGIKCILITKNPSSNGMSE